MFGLDSIENQPFTALDPDQQMGMDPMFGTKRSYCQEESDMEDDGEPIEVHLSICFVYPTILYSSSA